MMDRAMLRQLSALIPVTMIQLTIGIGLGWLAPALSQFKNGESEFPVTEGQCSWIASLHHVTRATTPFLSAVLIDRVGRSSLFVAIAFILLIMWIITLTTRHVFALYVVRLAEGLAAGIYDSSISIYIGENFSPRVRGIFTGITCIAFFAGMFIAYVLANFLSYTNIAMVYTAIAFLTVLSMVWLTEPPQFLIMKGKEVKARKNFGWLRDINYEDAKKEFEEIRQYVLEEKCRNSFTALFRSREVRQSVRAIIIIMFLLMFTGYGAINAFTTVAFDKSIYLKPNEFTILLGFLQLITCCASTLFLDKFRRRTLLMIACLASALIQAATAILYYINYSYQVPYFDWILFSTLSAYSSVYGMILRPLTTVIRGEVLPQSAKAYGSSLSIVATSTAGFILSYIFLPVSNRYGIEVNFVLYFIASCLMLVYIFLELPETKGMTLVEIQRTIQCKIRNEAKPLPKFPECEKLATVLQ